MFKIGENTTHLELAKTIASKMQKGYAYNARDIQKFFVDNSGFPIYSEQQIHRIMNTACCYNLYNKGKDDLFLDVKNYLEKQGKPLGACHSRMHYMLVIEDEKKDNDDEEEDDYLEVFDEEEVDDDY